MLGMGYISVITTLRRLKQETLKFKANLGYIANSRTAWETTMRKDKTILAILKL